MKLKQSANYGDAGGGDHWHEDSKDYFFTSIAELAVY